MNPLRIRLEGVRRYAELYLEIPDGCVAITGGNGAGKSTILNAIEVALFADGSRDLAPLLAPWTDRLLIRLEFEHAGETYRVRRGYKQSGSRGSATLDLERLVATTSEYGHGLTASTAHAASWEPLTREDAKATQALLEEILGLSRRTFRASSFLAQGDAAAFPEASPADRKAIIGDALDPRQLWPRLAEAAHARARTIDAELATDRGRAAHLDEIVAANANLPEDQEIARIELDLTGAAVKAAEEQLEDAQAAETANAGAAALVRAAAAERDTAQAAAKRAREDAQTAQEAEEELPAAREKLAGLDALAARIPELEQAWRDQTALVAAADNARTRKVEATAAAERQRAHVAQLLASRLAALTSRDELVARITHLELAPDGTEQCPTCSQLLGTEARAATLTTLTANLTAVDEQVAAQLAEIETAQDALEEFDAAQVAIEIPQVPDGDTETPLRDARTAVERAATGRALIQGYEEAAAALPARLETLREAAETLTTRERALEEASAGVKDTAQLAAAVQEARAALTGRRQAHQAAAATVARLDERATRVTEAREQARVARAAIADQQSRLDILKVAERAYGRDGIPTLIAENTIAVIETDAQAILERMPMADGRLLSVELHTQREQKNGKLAEELTILVAHDDTEPRELRRLPSGDWTFSGGEVFRVSWALRWALAKLLASRRGAESRVLMIDEPDGLDASGMDALTEIVNDARTVFDKILVVSHQPQLATSFGQAIEIVMRDGVSELAPPVGAAVPAGVAA